MSLGVLSLGVVAALCALAGDALAEDKATRVRRSDEYDNLDNFLMGSSDYDNFFLKTAKSVPRIGRRSGGDDADQAPVKGYCTTARATGNDMRSLLL